MNLLVDWQESLSHIEENIEDSKSETREQVISLRKYKQQPPLAEN